MQSCQHLSKILKLQGPGFHAGQRWHNLGMTHVCYPAQQQQISNLNLVCKQRQADSAMLLSQHEQHCCKGRLALMMLYLQVRVLTRSPVKLLGSCKR